MLLSIISACLVCLGDPSNASKARLAQYYARNGQDPDIESQVGALAAQEASRLNGVVNMFGPQRNRQVSTSMPVPPYSGVPMATAGATGPTAPVTRGGQNNGTNTPTREKAKLLLIDAGWSFTESGQYVIIQGRVRNVSGLPLKSIRANVTIEDLNGQMVAETMGGISPLELAPDETASFLVREPVNQRFDHFNIKFIMDQSSVPFAPAFGPTAGQVRR